MIAIVLWLVIAEHSLVAAEHSVPIVERYAVKIALSTIAEPMIFAETSAVAIKAETQKLDSCMQNFTCKDELEYLKACYSDALFDKTWIKQRIEVLLDSSCSDDPVCASNELKARNLALLVNEAKARISRLQVEFACAVQTALFFKEKIVFGDFSQAWGLRCCFDCVLLNAEEEQLCYVFRKRMADIEAAVPVVIEASVHSLQGLDGFFDSVASYVRENRVELYPTGFVKPNLTEPEFLESVSGFHGFLRFVLCYLLFITCCKVLCFYHRHDNQRQFRAGKGRFCDGCCGLCLSNDENIPWVTVNLCEHSFHAECMDRLLKYGTTRCPMCMREIFV